MSVDGRPPVVVCAGAARTYGRGPASVAALRRADCELFGGMQVALTGRSGSGKSTLLHLLGGLDRPTEGWVRWPGGAGPPSKAPGTIGFVFQAPSLISTLDVTENVSLPLILAGVDLGSAIVRAREALAQIGVADLATKLPDELSGGQAQRVAVARALVSRPAAILADEPTGQLDSASAAAVADALIAAASQHGAALLVATHDERVASRLSERWYLADGILDTKSVVAC